MKIKILCPLWGYKQGDLKSWLNEIVYEGYDGIDTWIPADNNERILLLDYIKEHNLSLVIQQHQADGDTFEAFKLSYIHHLELCAEYTPLLINSHTGRDYFSFEQNLELIDIAQVFSEKSGIEVVHETHRGRFGFSPSVMKEYFEKRPEFCITADFSHWVCVTESFLTGFAGTLQEAIRRTKHIHARVGFEQGPQVTDFRAPEWKYATDYFLEWWDNIVDSNLRSGDKLLTFTTEFGPFPYMHTIPFTNRPVVDQFKLNCFMKDLIKERYSHLC